MFEPGTISRLIDYYFSKYPEEYENAFLEFFRINSKKDFKKLKIKDHNIVNGLFNEWFVYDYKLANGNTPLKDYYQKNPYKKSIFEMDIYRQLMKNKYSIFEILQVDLGRGLKIKDLRNNKVYYVNEVKATYQTEIGDLIFSRVAPVGDGYELVGADSSKLGTLNGVDYSQFKKEIFHKKLQFDPQIVAFAIYIGRK